jgi:chromate transporter
VDASRSSGSIGEVVRAALWLGLTSFGGPAAHVGYFRREYVERRRWLDDRTFAEYLALCHSLPGPTSSQLGIVIGSLRAGIPGGLAAWLAFTMPSAALMIGFAVVAESADIASAGWVHGLKLAAVAVVAQAVYLLARTLAPDWTRKAIALAAMAVALAWTDPLAQVAIIAGGAALGLAVATDAGPLAAESPPSPIGRRAGAVALSLFGLLLAAVVLVRFGGGAVGEGGAMLAALSRTGSLVFGGGHVVLPLLDAAVVRPGWVGEDQFLAGYGAAQAVPGPLFSFAAYLGAVAAPLGGAPGGLLALVAIYLPTFLLVFGALPFWDSLRTSPGFRRGLLGVNAAVVGLLAGALYRPVWTGAVGTVADVAVVGAGLLALATGRVPPIVVVAGSALAGQLIAG